MGWYQKDEKVTGDNENSRKNAAFRHILVVVYHPPYNSIIKVELKDSPGHARGTYRDNAKALTKITNSLRCNFGISIHPRVNPWFSVCTEKRLPPRERSLALGSLEQILPESESLTVTP
jgi:hypothetical protein